jgi:Protein of unknown function (DUF3175)
MYQHTPGFGLIVRLIFRTHADSPRYDGLRRPLMPAKAAKKPSPRRWSQRVTENSNALDLDRGVFNWSNPKRIASSLKRSAQASHRRKASPFQSAMSMLNFYINRAGSGLPARQKRVLTQAKSELRKAFGRSES